MLPIEPPIVPNRPAIVTPAPMPSPEPLPVPCRPRNPQCDDPNGPNDGPLVTGQFMAYTQQLHTFRLVLRDRFDQEHLGTIQIDSDRFCNVIAAVRQRFPGKSIIDSWEIL